MIILCNPCAMDRQNGEQVLGEFPVIRFTEKIFRPFFACESYDRKERVDASFCLVFWLLFD